MRRQPVRGDIYHFTRQSGADHPPPDCPLHTAKCANQDQTTGPAGGNISGHPKAKETLRIDLWTKDMPVDEMKVFFHQTLLSMSDTFFRATQDEKMSATMKDFCEYFAEKLELNK